MMGMLKCVMKPFDQSVLGRLRLPLFSRNYLWQGLNILALLATVRQRLKPSLAYNGDVFVMNRPCECKLTVDQCPISILTIEIHLST
jgi:hypothetical protein